MGDDHLWCGNEYLQPYPSIECFDGMTVDNKGNIINKGFYVYYHYDNRITPLVKWIGK